MDTQELWICSDCLSPLVNGDFTGLNYYYIQEEADIRYNEILEGMCKLGYIVLDSSRCELEFSYFGCNCCGTQLAGARYSFIKILEIV